jgi:hypothetical protein
MFTTANHSSGSVEKIIDSRRGSTDRQPTFV